MGTELPRVASAEDGLAHIVEETSRLLGLLVAAELRLQFFDTRVGALERLVLDESGLHQRIGGLRRASQAVRDHALGSRIAGAILQFGQAIEQFFHQFLLLRCHAALPGVHIRRLCGLPDGVTAGVTHAPSSVELGLPSVELRAVAHSGKQSKACLTAMLQCPGDNVGES